MYNVSGTNNYLKRLKIYAFIFMWYQSILETIGNTPLIRLNSITKDIKPTLLAKVEYFNPGHSVKDRIGLKMLEDAEKEGLIKPGGTIIEGTSGNTGMGLALAAIIKGYRCVFTTTDKQSMEKVNILRAMGAEVKICPTNVEPDDPRSYYSVAKRLSEEIPNSWYPNQYDNLSNYQAHYETTGPELWEQTDGKITHFVAGMGTGGTITGTAKYLKEKNPDIKIIGVDSVGSVYKSYFKTGVFDKSQIGPYLTEGIGEDIIPANVDFSYVDEVVQCPDKEAFVTTRALARQEGLFVGGSCGAAAWGAIDYIKNAKLDENSVVVVLLPDSGTRYVSKIYNDEWMIRNGFMDQRNFPTAQEVISKKPVSRTFLSANHTDLLDDVIKMMHEKGISQVPVRDDAGEFVGSVHEKLILSQLMEDPNMRTKPVSDIMADPLPVIDRKSGVDQITGLLNSGNAAVIVKLDDSEFEIITRSDIIQSIANSAN